MHTHAHPQHMKTCSNIRMFRCHPCTTLLRVRLHKVVLTLAVRVSPGRWTACVVRAVKGILMPEPIYTAYAH